MNSGFGNRLVFNAFTFKKSVIRIASVKQQLKKKNLNGELSVAYQHDVG